MPLKKEIVFFVDLTLIILQIDNQYISCDYINGYTKKVIKCFERNGDFQCYFHC